MTGNEMGMLQELLDQVGQDIQESNRRSAAVDARLQEQTAKLTEVEAKLPNFVPQSRFRKLGVVVLLGGLAFLAALSVTLVLTHSSTCGTRGVLVLALTSTQRNPIPPGLPPEELARVQEQRAQAQVFYRDALDKLDILWPCSGEFRALHPPPPKS